MIFTIHYADMNGFKKIDIYFANNPIFRKTRKWTKKIVFYLPHCAVFIKYLIRNQKQDITISC